MENNHRRSPIFFPLQGGPEHVASLTGPELHAKGLQYECCLSNCCVCRATCGSALVVWPGMLFSNRRVNKARY